MKAAAGEAVRVMAAELLPSSAVDAPDSIRRYTAALACGGAQSQSRHFCLIEGKESRTARPVVAKRKSDWGKT